MNPNQPPERQSGLNSISDFINNLGQKLKELFEGFMSKFGFSPETVTPEQRDRALLAAEIHQPTNPNQPAANNTAAAFNDTTNPLNEQGTQDKTNIMRVPTTVTLPVYSNETGQPLNSWVTRNGIKYWSNETGLLFDVPDVRFLIRDGYNSANGQTINQYLESRMVPCRFLGVSINGRIHPLIAARLRLVEQEMANRGVFYSRNGTNTIDSIHGFAIRSIQGTNKGVASRHSLGLAIDFSKNQNNRLLNIESGTFNDYIASTDYSPGFYQVMNKYFRGFMDWTANRRNGGERDTMQFDVVPNEQGQIPFNYNT